jgi:hypothetical protein
MSYIDTFDHEYLGNLGYLPIYHPLVTEICGKWGDNEFSCSPQNLVLGGGGGEHPALVIHRLEVLVASFILEQLTDENEKLLSPENVDWLSSCMGINTSEVLEYCGWNLRDSARFVEMAKSTSHFRPLKEDQSVEDWLFMSLGEFIYYSLPDLNPVPLEVLDDFKKIEIRSIMQNVKTNPPGYPQCAGRLIVDGTLVWGNHRWNR